MKLRYSFVLLFGLITLSGCGRKRIKYFPPIDRNRAYVHRNDDLMLTVYALSRNEAKSVFGIDVVDHGYQTLQMRMTNCGPHEYVLRPSYHGLPCVSGKHIARQMHYDTSQWMTWSSLGALLFLWEAIPCLIVPAGLSMREYNQKVTQDMRRHTLSKRETITIAPYEAVNKFIFVATSLYSPDFAISFLNNDTKKLVTFDVKV